MDVDKYTPLLTAAEFGRVGCLKVLLKYNACPKVQNRDGKNAVFLAAESDHLDIVKVRISNLSFICIYNLFIILLMIYTCIVILLSCQSLERELHYSINCSNTP